MMRNKVISNMISKDSKETKKEPKVLKLFKNCKLHSYWDTNRPPNLMTSSTSMMMTGRHTRMPSRTSDSSSTRPETSALRRVSRTESINTNSWPRSAPSRKTGHNQMLKTSSYSSEKFKSLNKVLFNVLK